MKFTCITVATKVIPVVPDTAWWPREAKFHDLILEAGGMAWVILEVKVQKWIETQTKD
jgi:hypothetical protein